MKVESMSLALPALLPARGTLPTLSTALLSSWHYYPWQRFSASLCAVLHAMLDSATRATVTDLRSNSQTYEERTQPKTTLVAVYIHGAVRVQVEVCVSCQIKAAKSKQGKICKSKACFSSSILQDIQSLSKAKQTCCLISLAQLQTCCQRLHPRG